MRRAIGRASQGLRARRSALRAGGKVLSSDTFAEIIALVLFSHSRMLASNMFVAIIPAESDNQHEWKEAK